MAPNNRSPRGTFFPIVEAFGFPHDSSSPKAHQAWKNEKCPFSGTSCEKHRQYKLGYCSVVYAADWDNGNPEIYAVCDHRLDGEPVEWAISDYFGNKEVNLVPEFTVNKQPKLNIDYIAFTGSLDSPDERNIIAIETQAIDLRGGGVGPAWEAWKADDVKNWRSYFTAEAKRKNRRDTVDYGVNTGNVYKRLATQILAKGEILKQVKVPLYVVMQQSILQQLRERVDFSPVEGNWDITFAGFEYDGTLTTNDQLNLKLASFARTSLDNYSEAMRSSGPKEIQRSDFIKRLKMKTKILRRPETDTLF